MCQSELFRQSLELLLPRAPTPPPGQTQEPPLRFDSGSPFPTCSLLCHSLPPAKSHAPLTHLSSHWSHGSNPVTAQIPLQIRILSLSANSWSLNAARRNAGGEPPRAGNSLSRTRRHSNATHAAWLVKGPAAPKGEAPVYQFLW